MAIDFRLLYLIFIFGLFLLKKIFGTHTNYWMMFMIVDYVICLRIYKMNFYTAGRRFAYITVISFKRLGSFSEYSHMNNAHAQHIRKLCKLP